MDVAENGTPLSLKMLLQCSGLLSHLRSCERYDEFNAEERGIENIGNSPVELVEVELK